MPVIYGPDGSIISTVTTAVDPLVAARQAATTATGAATTATGAATTATGAATTATGAATTATGAATSATNAATSVTAAATKIETTGLQLTQTARQAAEAAEKAANAANNAAKAATEAADALKASQATAAAQTAWWGRLVKLLTFSQGSTRVAKLASGLGVAAVAIDALTIANMGNPGLFTNKAMQWQITLYEELDHAWIDFRTAYDLNITGTWQGTAKTSMDAFLLRQISPAIEALKALAHQIASSLTAVSASVESLNLDGAQSMIASVAFLNALLALDVSTAGAAKPALIAGVLAYIMMVVFWLNSLINLMNNAKGQVVAITNEASRVKNTIWANTASRTTPTPITLPSTLTDPNNANNSYWERVPTLGTS